MGDAAEQFVKAVQRDLNCLADPDRSTRKRAVEKLSRVLVDGTDKTLPSPSQDVLDAVYVGHLLKPLLRLMNDEVERCRETAVAVVTACNAKVTNVAATLPYVVPAVEGRLAGNEPAETTEEIRLALMELLTTSVRTAGEAFRDYMDEVRNIVTRSFSDEFPDVKKETARCVVALCAVVPRPMALISVEVVKALLPALKHQHYKVRVVCLEALGAVIPCGAATVMDELAELLRVLNFDRNNSVRLLLVNVVKAWLKLDDRESHDALLFPLLLTALHDELPAVQEAALAAFQELGAQYEEDYEKDLRDRKAYAEPSPFDALDKFPAPFTSRPSLGARMLIRNRLSRMITMPLRDMERGWTTQLRYAQAAVVQSMVIFCENHVTGQLEGILTALYNTCRDEEESIRETVRETALILGRYIDPSVYLPLVLEQARGVSELTMPSRRISAVIILAQMLRGSADFPATFKGHVHALVAEIAGPSFTQSDDTEYLTHFMHLVATLIECAGSAVCAEEESTLFAILVQLRAARANPIVQEQAGVQIEYLATNVLGRATVDELYERHFADLLRAASADVNSWHKHSSNLFVLDSLLRSTSRAIVATQLGDLLVPVLAAGASTSRAVEVQSVVLEVLHFLLDGTTDAAARERPPMDDNVRAAFAAHGAHILAKILLPQMVWRVGKPATALRETAAKVVLQLLAGGLLAPADVAVQTNKVGTGLANVLPVFASCLEDDFVDTRLHMCHVYARYLPLARDALWDDSVNMKPTHEVYAALLKRLDDSADAVRIAVCAAIDVYLADVPPNWSSTHFEEILNTLLVHLDDANGDVQNAVAAILPRLAAMDAHAAYFRSSVSAVQGKMVNFGSNANAADIWALAK